MNLQMISSLVEVCFVSTFVFAVFYVVVLAAGLIFPFKSILEQIFSTKSGKHRIDGNIVCVEQNQSRAVKLVARSTSDDEIFTFFSKPDGSFTLYLPDGEFSIRLQQFGIKQLGEHELILDDKNRPTRLDIRAKQAEEIIIDPPIVKFLNVAKLVWLVLAIICFGVNFLNTEYLELSQSLILLASAVISTFLAVYSERFFFKLIDFSNRPLKSKKIVIKNSQGKPLANLTTNNSGRLKIFAARGIYKLESDSHLQRTFKVDNNSIVSLNLKL